MRPVIFKDFDVVLNAPPNWKPSRDGSCSALPCRYMQVKPNANISMESFWKPDADELKALNEGASVGLGVLAQRHPVVYVFVEKVEEHELPDWDKI